jgi:hypothetical protein
MPLHPHCLLSVASAVTQVSTGKVDVLSVMVVPFLVLETSGIGRVVCGVGVVTRPPVARSAKVTA